jgi:REP element-mobilizing transposase RayT
MRVCVRMRTCDVMMNRNFKNCAFVTLTYARNASIGQTWLRCTKDTNRYLQRINRKFNCKVEYLRAFESHKDGFPHVHLLIIFPTEFDIRDNGRYLQQSYYMVLKSQWPYGLSDAQSPRSKNNGAIGYILKYLNKSSSSNTLWSKLLPEGISMRPPEVDGLGYPIKPPPGNNVWKYVLIKDKSTLLYTTLKWKRIKLLMWSRDFTEMFKNSQ